MEETMGEQAEKKGQIEKEMDGLEGVTTTLLGKLEGLDKRLQSVCHERTPASESEVIKQQESPVPLASLLQTLHLRVEDAIGRVDSIMERLEL